MKPPKTYLRDQTDSDVKGIVILDANERKSRYYVTENRDGEWCYPFFMPEGELESYDTEEVGVLSSRQILDVCRASGAVIEGKRLSQ